MNGPWNGDRLGQPSPFDCHNNRVMCAQSTHYSPHRRLIDPTHPTPTGTTRPGPKGRARPHVPPLQPHPSPYLGTRGGCQATHRSGCSAPGVMRVAVMDRQRGSTQHAARSSSGDARTAAHRCQSRKGTGAPASHLNTCGETCLWGVCVWGWGCLRWGQKQTHTPNHHHSPQTSSSSVRAESDGGRNAQQQRPRSLLWPLPATAAPSAPWVQLPHLVGHLDRALGKLCRLWVGRMGSGSKHQQEQEAGRWAVATPPSSSFNNPKTWDWPAALSLHAWGLGGRRRPIDQGSSGHWGRRRCEGAELGARFVGWPSFGFAVLPSFLRCQRSKKRLDRFPMPPPPCGGVRARSRGSVRMDRGEESMRLPSIDRILKSSASGAFFFLI